MLATGISIIIKEAVMTRTLLFSAMGAMLSIGLATSAYAAQGQTDAGAASGQASPDTGSKLGSPAQPGAGQSISPGTAGRVESIEGEVLRIEGDIYVVKDTSGREVRLHVDKNTNIDGNITPKDLIIARGTKMSAGPGDWQRPSGDLSQGSTGERSQGMPSDRNRGMSSDRSQGMAGDRSSGMAGDRPKGVAPDASQAAATWHVDSIKKR
jgi:uncharacterized protein YdeI (BOF family)